MISLENHSLNALNCISCFRIIAKGVVIGSTTLLNSAISRYQLRWLCLENRFLNSRMVTISSAFFNPKIAKFVVVSSWDRWMLSQRANLYYSLLYNQARRSSIVDILLLRFLARRVLLNLCFLPAESSMV